MSKVIFPKIDKDYFYGVDTPLVISAIKKTGLKITPDVLEATRDLVADAIVLHDPKKQPLNGWVFNLIRYQLGSRYLRIQQGKSAKAKKYAPDFVYSLDLEVPQQNGQMSVLHETVASDADVESTVVQELVRESVKKAIKNLDERGQFIMNFYLASENPSRCGRELGDALAKTDFVSYKEDGVNKRSRAQQLLNQYFGKMKRVLEKMGFDAKTLEID